MKTPQIASQQFLSNTAFNDNFALIKESVQEQNEGNMSVAGLISPNAVLFQFNGNLIVTVNAPLPFRVVFGNGIMAKALGTTDGQTTTVYDVNFASLVPGSGSVTVYLVCQTQTIQQSPVTVIGPPPGHPDYDPSFVPVVAYTEVDDTLNLFATTTAPDNETTFELGRVTLSAGQTSIASIDTSHWVYASSVLDPTGVASGTYTTPQLTVGSDGRIISASNNTNIATQNGNNNFTGNNTFSGTTTNSGTISGGTISGSTLSGTTTNSGTISGGTIDPSTLTVSGSATFDGGLSVPSGQTATVAGTLSVTGSETVASSTITTLNVTGPFTLSGALNANGGLTVPSGQTATVAGTLDVTGTATVPAATASGNPVAYQQVTQKISGTVQNPIGTNYGTTSSVKTISMTTGTFTAPSNGNLVIIGAGVSSTGTAIGISVTASLSGLVNIVAMYAGYQFFSFSFLPMQAAQVSTVSTTLSQTTAGGLSGTISAFFLPTP